MSYFHDLREDVRTGAHAPDLEAIHRTAKRRRQTRLSVTAGVAVVAVIAGTYALVQPHPQHASDSGPVHGPIAGATIPVSGSMKMLALYPIDTQTTYAVATAADGRQAILRTTDGGREWKAWALPNEVQTSTDRESLTGDVNAPSDILGRLKDPSFLTNWSFTVGGYLTRDGGESWQQIDGTRPSGSDRGMSRITVGPDVPAVPDGWRVGVGLIDGREVRLAAVDPATGVWHKLATQPQGVSQVVVGPDGTIWATTTDGKRTYQNLTTTTTGLAVSHDRGRTWRTYTLPQAEGNVGDPLVALDGQHALADVMIATIPPNGGIQHKYTLVTDDGGRTWTKRTNDRSMPFGGMVLPDGSVLGFNSAYTACWHPNAIADKLILTTDLGKTCTPVEGTDKPGRLARTVSGAYVLSNRTVNPTGYRISTDGLHWQPAPMPPIN
jgi:hypothetical protein